MVYEQSSPKKASPRLCKSRPVGFTQPRTRLMGRLRSFNWRPKRGGALVEQDEMKDTRKNLTTTLPSFRRSCSSQEFQSIDIKGLDGERSSLCQRWREAERVDRRKIFLQGRFLCVLCLSRHLGDEMNRPFCHSKFTSSSINVNYPLKV